MKTIPKQVLQGLKSIANETIEQGIDNVKKAVGMVDSADSGQDLFPDIKGMSDEQKARLEKQDEERKQREIESLRNQMGKGRDVEGEIEAIRKQKEQEEEEKEKEFLENLKRQRLAEQQERQKMAGEVATPQHKRKKSRGSAFAHGKKPSSDQMSATSEFSKKPD